jgi:hypothetical protein
LYRVTNMVEVGKGREGDKTSSKAVTRRGGEERGTLV